MAALRIISAWAILLHIRTGKCKFMIMESSHRNASHITGHPWGESTGKQWTTCKGPVMVSMIREKAVDWTVELYMISDTGTSMSRYCNGASAGHMCFCVHFCSVFVCIWGHFYVHLGGVLMGILWLFCVHFSQFCDLMGIQILHYIRLWHHVAYIFAARMAEYISAFRYILNL